jgi:hypothetical protein
MLLERHDRGVVHCHVEIWYAASQQVRWIAAVLDPVRSGTTHPAAPLLFTSRMRNHFFGIDELLDMTPCKITWTFRGFVFVTKMITPMIMTFDVVFS